MEAVDKMRSVLETREKATQDREQARLDKFSKMAEEVEKRNARQNAIMAGQDPELIVEEPVIQDEPAADEPVAAADDVVIPEEEDYSRLITRKVNGVDQTKTLADWLLLADAADQQIRQAVTRPAPVIDVPEIDDEAIARAISLGDPEESTNAVKTLKQSIVNEVAKASNLEQQKLQGATVWQNFLKDYPEIAGDKMLIDLVIKNDSDMLNDGKVYGADPVSAFHNRVRLAGDQVMQWKKNLDGISNKKVIEEKKKGIRTLSNINTKQALKEPKVLSEAEAKALAVKEMMDRRRRRT